MGAVVCVGCGFDAESGVGNGVGGACFVGVSGVKTIGVGTRGVVVGVALHPAVNNIIRQIQAFLIFNFMSTLIIVDHIIIGNELE